MSRLPTFLSAFDKLFTGHPICFTNSLLVVLSAGGEKIFQSVAFKCPKHPELAKWYGWLFLFAPLFILLVYGMVLNESLWRVYHGCQKRSEGTELSRGQRCRSFWFTFFRSLIVPSAWLFVSLLDGTYIVCSLAKRPDEETDETLLIKAFSQIAGWIFLVAVVIVGTLVTCWMRCHDEKTFLELRYSEVYKKLEKEELEKKMKEKAQELAEANVSSLFSEDLPPKKNWDKVTVPVVTVSDKKAAKDSDKTDAKDSDKTDAKDSDKTDAKEDAVYYSPLHKWSDQEKKKRGNTNSGDSAL